MASNQFQLAFVLLLLLGTSSQASHSNIKTYSEAVMVEMMNGTGQHDDNDDVDALRLPPPPSQWPQSPLLLRPTPGTGMKIRGLRYSSDPADTSRTFFPETGSNDVFLPLNAGTEEPGKAIVVDFESPLFVGTLLLRVKGVPPVESKHESSDDEPSKSYFDGRKRKFQILVRGHFKQDGIPMAEVRTGQLFDRAAKRLPARWIVSGIIKLFTTISPQLEANLDGDHPRFLSPTAAQAHTITSVARNMGDASSGDECSSTYLAFETSNDDENKVTIETTSTSSTFSTGSASTSDSWCSSNLDMEGELEEPLSTDPASIMYKTLDNAAGSTSKKSHKVVSQDKRRAQRKKTFNHLAATHVQEPVFDVDREYTFEFFQHLFSVDPDDFVIHTATGGIGLAKRLDGQPIKLMTTVRSPDMLKTVLWSFDLWHAALYPYATAAAAAAADEAAVSSKS